MCFLQILVVVVGFGARNLIDFISSLGMAVVVRPLPLVRVRRSEKFRLGIHASMSATSSVPWKVEETFLGYGLAFLIA